MRKFEIPFNGDLNLIDDLGNFPEDCIHCIYMVPPWELYHSVSRDSKRYDAIIQETSLNKFKYQVRYINTKFPGKIQLLLQNPVQIINEEDLEKYVALGITKFCAGTITQATKLRNLNDKNIEITASVLNDIDETLLEYFPQYSQVFDNIVLPFRFCHDIEHVKNIKESYPDFKYILFCNSECSRFCRHREHWICEDKSVGLCPANRELSEARIVPKDLKEYDKYIDIYKLVDRRQKTPRILKSLTDYLEIN